MENKDKIVAICLQCDGEFTEQQVKGKVCCPNCKSTSIPINPENDVTIKINTHELRILGIWAENYASSVDSKSDGSEKIVPTVQKIAQKIESQLPPNKWVPLTLMRELIDLKEHLKFKGDISLIRDDKETKI